MADPRFLAGIATIAIDGVSYSIAGEAAYKLSGNERTTLKGQDGIHGYSEMPDAGKISFKGRDSGAMSIDTLNRSTNATVTLSLANGKTIIGRNMWRVGPPVEVNTEDATFQVDFEGTDVAEA